MSKTKPFCISKVQVWEAYRKVRTNRGGAGIDRLSIEEFEQDLKNNLYKIWNRMSSGTYFPPPVRTVAIPKKDGSQRKLGIPTVADRVAQMVVKDVLEPILEPHFHPDSFGYRPGKSAHQAVDLTRTRCWKECWVVDLDIKSFFDNLSHELLLKAVRHHCNVKWVVLYIERWLSSEIDEDGKRTVRTRGTPQGGVISPLLANLFLHYTFDHWMARTYADVKFERYADDIIVHSPTLTQAHRLKDAIARRLSECELAIHPEKTQIVFCRNYRDRKNSYPEKFDFLGFTFRQRTSRSRSGELFDSFAPGMSPSSRKRISDRIRFWRVGAGSDLSLMQMSEMYSPVMRGWLNYYGRFHPEELRPIWKQWNQVLTNWANRKYKRFHGHRSVAGKWIDKVRQRDPKLFPIWDIGSMWARNRAV